MSPFCVESSDLQYVSKWTVVPLSIPKLIKNCSRCSHNRFVSSNKFRVNANKKVIDIWLIYKCIHCDYTFNLPIITRTSVSKLNQDVLERFQVNDEAFAWQYGFKADRLQHSIQLDWDIEYEGANIQENSDEKSIF